MPREDSRRRHAPPKPPTLAQIAAARARGVLVRCPNCGRQATLLLGPLIARLGAGALFPDVRRRLRCSECGARPIDAAPDYPNVMGPSARHQSYGGDAGV